MEELFDGKHVITDDEMYKAQDEQLNRWEEDIGGKTIIVLGPAYKSPYGALEKAAKRLASSKGPMYTLEIDRNGREVYRGTELSHYARTLRSFIGLYKNNVSYSPYIQLFFDAVEKLWLWDEMFTSPGASSAMGGKKVAQRLNDFVETMQQEARTERFKKSVKQRQENSTRKLKSARTYVAKLFAWRSRLLVLRVDLEYRTDLDPPVTISQARKDLKRLWDNRLKNKLFDHMGGYIWSLEFGGRGRGYHFHVAFFFDGARVQNDPYIARQIGEYWVKTVTKGRGAYHNCNRDKASYSRLNRLGIGRIERDELEKRQNLDLVVQYMTKKDYCLKPDFDSGRVFGKGGSPPVNTSGVGRPPRTQPKENAQERDPSLLPE